RPERSSTASSAAAFSCRRQPMLYLVRHGQSHANAEGLLVGRLDSGLTDKGVEMAERLGTELAARGVGSKGLRILTSPLTRARRTAELIAVTVGGEAEVEQRLIEIDYGE